MRKAIVGFALLLLLPVLHACDGSTSAPVPTQVVVTPGDAVLEALGATQQFSAEVRDEDGNPLTGVPITWSSTNEEVATVDATGTATAVSRGTATIRASVGEEGTRGSALLQVIPEPAALTKVTGDEQIGGLLQPLAVKPTVEVRDARGNALKGVRVYFTVVSGGGSVSPTSGLTDEEGQASTSWTLGMVSSEPQLLRATAGDVVTEFTATAEPGSIVILTENLDDGRAELPYETELTAIGGSETGYAWSVTGGQLPAGMELSQGGVLGGVPGSDGSYAFQVQVTDSEDNTFSRQLSLRVCPAPLDLAPGERAVLSPTGGSGCGFFLPTGNQGDRYRIGLIYASTDTVPFDLASATVTMTERMGFGASSAQVSRARAEQAEQEEALATAQAAASPLSSRDWRGGLPTPLRDALEVDEATEAFHYRLRHQEQQMLLEMGPDARPLPDVPAVLRASGLSQASPEKISLNPNPTSSCSASYSPVPAVKIAENDLMVMYQDSVQHASEPVAASLGQMMLDYYEDHGVQVIDSYFGGVTDIDGNGKIVVLVTPVVEDNVAAYVWSGDFFPRDGSPSCNSSNEMELIRFNKTIITGESGENGRAGIPQGNYQALATLVHEVKHVSSLYKSIRRFNSFGGVGGGYHPVWIEEGTAEIAGEMSSRLAWENAGGPAVDQMIVRADKVITEESYGVLLRWVRTLSYLTSQPNGLVVTPQGAQSGHSVYGSGWHFHRWLGDAFGDAGSARLADSSLFRTQNDSLTSSGVAGILELTGKSWSGLLEDYATAVMFTGMDAPPPARPFTSYDFPDVTTDLLVEEFQPSGFYPWPVNVPGNNHSVDFTSGENSGLLGPGGLRVLDLTSDGEGLGLELKVQANETPVRIITVRVR